MSQENVALARGIYEDFKAGRTEFDAEGTITRMAGEELWDPDIEWDASGAVVPDLTGIYRGKTPSGSGGESGWPPGRPSTSSTSCLTPGTA
jgi:hypothetical protein